MSSTLSRRIRRIGILPTTFQETSKEVTVKKDGKKVQEIVTLRNPVRNYDLEMTNQQKDIIAAELISSARSARKARKNKLAKAA
jgi:antitoxin (DNA-binding transcriptional repressor) of toxin-antitoxin stability system